MLFNCCCQEDIIITPKIRHRVVYIETRQLKYCDFCKDSYRENIDETPKYKENICNNCSKLVCNDCYGVYECDTGYGKNKIRFLDDFDKCPVCDSTPEKHPEWFIKHNLTHYRCEECKDIVEIDKKCCNMVCKECSGDCETHCMIFCGIHYECNSFSCNNCGEILCSCCFKCGYRNRLYCRCFY